MLRLALIALLATPAGAQEYDAQAHADAMASAGQGAAMQAMRDGDRPQRHTRRKQPISSSAIATCRSKAGAARRLGRTHPTVARLYRLCAQAGY